MLYAMLGCHLSKADTFLLRTASAALSMLAHEGHVVAGVLAF